MPNISQNNIRINTAKYLKALGLPENNMPEIGQCEEMTDLWLYAKWLNDHLISLDNNNEIIERDDVIWLKKTLEKIANLELVNSKDINPDKDIDHFISRIENSKQLQSTVFQTEYTLGVCPTEEQLTEIIKQIVMPGKMVKICSHISNADIPLAECAHATGLYLSTSKEYSFYDSNTPYFEIKSREPRNIAKLIFTFNLYKSDSPSPLGFNIFSSAEEKIATYPSQEKIIQEIAPLDNTDFNYVHGLSALYVASKIGSIESVRSLLKIKNNNLNQKNSYGITPLYIASLEGHLGIVKILIENGANVNTANNNNSTPLFIASQNGHVDIVILLIEKGAFVNTENNKGSTPLHIASGCGHLNTVATLIEKNADVNAVDNHGFVALDFALKNGYSDIAIKLIENGADVNAENTDELVPLYIVSQNGYINVVVKLLENGADPKLLLNNLRRNIYENYDVDFNEFFLFSNSCDIGIKKIIMDIQEYEKDNDLIKHLTKIKSIAEERIKDPSSTQSPETKVFYDNVIKIANTAIAGIKAQLSLAPLATSASTAIPSLK